MGAGVYGFPGEYAKFMQTPGQWVQATQAGDTTNNIFTPDPQYKTFNNFENTIHNDEATLAFNSDTLAFIDQGDVGAYGTAYLANWVDFFRSGYVEFVIKTTKTNCIVASGTNEADTKDINFLGWLLNYDMQTGVSSTAVALGDTATIGHAVSTNVPYYEAPAFDNALMNLNIEINNLGKITVNYYDEYNRDDVTLNFEGNQNIADNQWHHIVVNFGRPGTIKEHGKKFNKHFIEIWVDGQLDKRFDDKLNKYQIFYPTIKWLFNNVSESIKNVLKDDVDIESNYDDTTGLSYAGINEILTNSDIYKYCVNNIKNQQKAFAGGIHIFAHGVNIPLSQYEIKKRFRLWRKDNKTKLKAKTLTVSAEMKTPTINTNSKKALKLYWNELVENGKNGLTLDKNLQVETYSVINQSDTSKTEIFNIDRIIKKEINILQNVRASFTDNLVIYGPGLIHNMNTQEAYFNFNTPHLEAASQVNPKDTRILDAVSKNQQDRTEFKLWFGPRTDLYMSGLDLQKGDRILLTNQIKTEENGIWIFNGMGEYLTRSLDSLIQDNTKEHIVYVTDGYNVNTYWKLEKTITSLSDPQRWDLIEYQDIQNLNSIPIHKSRWKDYYGEDRLINLEEDININKYDVIVFMNYPETNEEIYQHFPNEPEAQVIKQYNNFLQSIKNVVAQGASLYVSSPRLARDLGIVKGFTEINQLLESEDLQSALTTPFEINESANRYFDTHRVMSYHLDTEVAGLTDKETYVLTEFINYLPENVYDYEEYHAKYSYRPLGLKEGNEFIIPGLAIREVTESDKLPGYRGNYRGTKPIMAVALNDIITGTVVTSLQNNYYNGSTITANPYDDYATTIIVHNGQLLGTQPVTGKIFVNCVEDAYAFSRDEYNKARIQIIPQNEVNENTNTRAFQYSTTRLNRLPRRINVTELTENGQTTPTNGGGGAFIQATSNASYGVIRSETDKGNKDFQSDLYPTEAEEIYPTQEIPVLSMTWLGLQWLTG